MQSTKKKNIKCQFNDNSLNNTNIETQYKNIAIVLFNYVYLLLLALKL